MSRGSTYLNYLCIIFTVTLVTCKGKSLNTHEDNDSVKTEEYKQLAQSSKALSAKIVQSDTFSYNDEFISGPYTIVVTTRYINDSLSGDEAWEAIQWPIVETQEVMFKYKDSISTVFHFPTRKIHRRTTKGKTVDAAELVIWNANLIQGKKTILFGIFEATGLCSGSYCPTYDGVFNLDGSLIYQIFKDESKRQSLVIGNEVNKVILSSKKSYEKLDNIYRVNGITQEILNEAWITRRKIGVNK